MALIQWKQINPNLEDFGYLTGSLNLSGSQTITGNLTVDGVVSAQAYHSEVISASILFESGSSKFGNTADDTHSFTGSLAIDGNLLLDGSSLATEASVTSLSSSLSATVSSNTNSITSNTSAIGVEKGRIDSILSASDASTDTFKEVVDLINSVDLANDQSFAGFVTSSNSRISTLEAFSSSLDSTFASDEQLNTVSASLASSISSISTDFDSITNKPTLISSSAQLATDISGSFTNASSSIATDISALQGFSSSLDAAFATDQQLVNLETTLDGRLDALEAGSSVNYISSSITRSMAGLEIADFDNNVGVTYVGDKLKLTFGTPSSPSGLSANTSGYDTSRFNQETDQYTINGSWNNGGYNLISASLYEGSLLLVEVGTGTSLSFSTTTSGSHSYRLEYTASSPLDDSLYTNSTSVYKSVSPTNPSTPSLSTTPSVQLGASSNQIEQGATGTIAFSANYGSSNGWDQVSLVTSPNVSPITVSTGNSTDSISVIASYASPAGANSPDITTTRSSSRSFSKIRSVRYGASTATTFTQSELEDLASWDTSLGGSIGTINKGNTSPSGDTVTIQWTGDKYHYIAFDSNRANLNGISTSGFAVLGQFSVSTIGNYKLYRSTALQSGGAGSSITYVLT